MNVVKISNVVKEGNVVKGGTGTKGTVRNRDREIYEIGKFCQDRDMYQGKCTK